MSVPPELPDDADPIPPTCNTPEGTLFEKHLEGEEIPQKKLVKVLQHQVRCQTCQTLLAWKSLHGKSTNTPPKDTDR